MKDRAMKKRSYFLSAACMVLAACSSGGGGNSGGGNTGGGGSTDSTSPNVSFSPTSISLNSGETGNSTLTTSDNVGVTSTNVTCTNGGEFSGDVLTAPFTESDVIVECTATARDAAGNTGSAVLTANVSGAPLPASVKISGRVTFDLVPLNTTTNGLDYDNTVRSGARGVTVEIVNASGSVVDTTVTNANGGYSFDVAPGTDLRVRAKAEMVSTSGARWDVKVVDNTSNDALYAIQGNLVNSGDTDSVRSLYARSGWGGSSYTGTRAAGPFAILNPIYDAHQKVAAVDPDVNLPAMTFNWSPNNTSTDRDNDLSTGLIGTSFYSQGKVYVLGDDDVDTDEYDDHVIVHEWGHYFEDNMSRSDSIGGQHSGGDRLDPRVAFGEGFGNALSGIITDDPVYRDSNSSGQASGFSINVENNNYSPEGWFNEGSVQSILYDIYDAANDGADNISAGFGPIYNTLVSADYVSTPLFTSIFHFAEEYKNLNTGDSAAVDALLSAQSINGTGSDGTGETNSGSISNALPVYKTITSNGPALNICSLNNAGTFNKLGVRTFIRLIPTASGTHTLTMTRQSGSVTLDPDFLVFDAGDLIAPALSETANSETWSGSLQAGTTYLIDAYEYNNVDGVSGDYCYNFTVTN